MPRDISGNYTLPAGNPVVNGTIIDITWGNGSMNDIATQLNNVITRDGVLNPTAAIKFAAGTAAVPGISFALDPAVGFYRAASQTLGISAGGLGWATLNGTGNWLLTAASVGTTFTLTGGASVDNLTVSATATLKDVNISGNTNIGDAPADTTTFAGANITWSGNPVHSGNHTFTGSIAGPAPTLPGSLATKSYVDSTVISTYDQVTTAMAVCNYLGL